MTHGLTVLMEMCERHIGSLAEGQAEDLGSSQA